MVHSKFACLWLLPLAFLVGSLTVSAQEAPPSKMAGQAAAQTVQNDAARVAGASAAVTAEAAEKAAAPAAPSLSVRPAPELQIGPGDLLGISVYGIPDFTQDVRVGNSGDIYLPLVGYVQIGGLTQDQAQTVIENRLREGDFVRSPHVTVFIKEYVNALASVTGEVTRPGTYAIIGSRRLLDVLAAAGGLTARAGRQVIITHRNQADEPVKLLLPTDPAQGAQEKSNVEILPGDTVVVAKAGIVYVVGEVGRPAGLIMESNESMTVLQAIALAGGTSPVAKLNSAKLIRKTEKGREEVPLPLSKILANKSDDISLKADDIIYVPTSWGKKAAKRGVDSIVALSTTAAIYRP